MVGESLELIRNKNIQRNKELLARLNLNEISKSVTPLPKPGRGRPRTAGLPKVSKPAPVRRSRRLANTPELKDELKKEEEAAQIERTKEEERQEERTRRLAGLFILPDLTTDIRLGQLRFEDRIFSKTRHEPDLKKEDDEEAYNLLCNRIAKLGSYSKEDTTDDNMKKERSKKPDRAKVERELQNLKIFSQELSDLKLTLQRITALTFHLNVEDRLIVAGDTSGNIGLWAMDQTYSDQPLIVTIKPHGRAVSRICEVPQRLSQIVTASYDGSLRITDVVKGQNFDLISLNDAEGSPLGISDATFHSSLPHQISITTLDGHFYQHDTRVPQNYIDYRKLLRLHDKKIGGFAANPNNNYQIASASLDRSIRLWDLRNCSNRKRLSEIDDLAKCPHFYGGYSSKLSVSVVDWNFENRLVCNGYDNTINIFDLSGSEGMANVETWKKTFTISGEKINKDETTYYLREDKRIKHNCQTGRWVSILKARWQRLPHDNIQKFVIGNMNRSLDIFDQYGSPLARLSDPNTMTAVPAVATFHPTHNWVVGGTSSGKIYLFT